MKSKLPLKGGDEFHPITLMKKHFKCAAFGAALSLSKFGLF